MKALSSKMNNIKLFLNNCLEL